MHYFKDLDAGVTVCIMSEKYDVPVREGDDKKSNLEHALDYICGGVVKDYLSRVNMESDYENSKEMISLFVRELCRPFIEKHIKDEYKGIARCSPGDIYDEEMGTTIARAKCLRAFYSDITAAILEIGHALNHSVDKFSEAILKAEASVDYWDNVLYSSY